MIKTILITSILLLATTIMCAQNKTGMEQVLNNHKKIYKAISSKNEHDLQLMLSHGFVFTSALAEVWDKEKFLKGFALNPAIGLPLFETTEQNITIIDNTAILTALAHINIKKGHQPVQELWERVTETYVKQQGKWTLVALQATFVQKNH